VSQPQRPQRTTSRSLPFGSRTPKITGTRSAGALRRSSSPAWRRLIQVPAREFHLPGGVYTPAPAWRRMGIHPPNLATTQRMAAELSRLNRDQRRPRGGRPSAGATGVSGCRMPQSPARTFQPSFSPGASSPCKAPGRPLAGKSSGKPRLFLFHGTSGHFVQAAVGHHKAPYLRSFQFGMAGFTTARRSSLPPFCRYHPQRSLPNRCTAPTRAIGRK